ncbi:MAG: hypothetical protein AAFT19_07805 [Pseudomonadota bacterium]
MAIDLLFILTVFTLGGGVAHAAYNLHQTRKLREQGENPYRLPGVYQKRQGNPISATLN